MNRLTISACVLTSILLATTANAQCGCAAGAMYMPQPVYMAPPMVQPAMTYAPIHSASPAPSKTINPGSVAYINRLATPIDRGTYVLKYAVHLNDGNILLTDFLPPGYSVQGVEQLSGGRKIRADYDANGGIVVTDPLNDRTVARINAQRGM